ncbi:MAG: SHOCT domain-containing protein [Candidatus Nanohaloarchaea archaeon]|nr:SHOCT domain-containing protein [Candidatus Nanohaloarchaea archaeon]
MISAVGIPFAMGFGLLALAGFVLTIYVFYDVLANQEEMQVVEKLIWLAAVLAFNLFGVIAYLVIVKSQGEYIMDREPVADEERRLDELERLQELKEDGALTEDEFEAEKERLLEG